MGNNPSSPNSPIYHSVDDSVIANLKPGDLIKISRGASSGLRVFYHFAVYIGDGYCIHLTKGNEVGVEYCKCPDEDTFQRGNIATECRHCRKRYRSVVVSELLKDVVNIGTFTVANNLDSKHSPLPEDEIIAKAKSLLGPIHYNISRYNCEHFAYWCRNDVAVSFQSLIRWFNVKRYKQTIIKP